MKIKTIILSAFFFLSFFVFTENVSAANYYVDCSASTNGNGTFGSPWNNLPSVNAKTFATGDDVYFKVGTTCYLNSDSDRLQVDWSGTGSNRVIIGAYHGNGKFGLGGFERPIIDGRLLYPGTEQAAIWMSRRSYVTVRDLKIQNIGSTSTSRGFAIFDSSGINIENCHIYRTRGNALVYMRVKTGQIVDNISEDTRYPDYTRSGAAIEVSGGNIEGATKDILIARNKVFRGWEGIGLYKKVTNSIVEYNIVNNTRSYMIYVDAGKGNIIRYNLVYKDTSNSLKSWAITICNENFHQYLFSGNNQIYGNMIAGTRRGISLSCEIRKTITNASCHVGTKVYHNTIVDTEISFGMDYPSAGDSIDIKNNISWVITAGNRHVNLNNPAGVTWSHNLFRGGTLPTGNAATNMVTGDPKLTKISGWLTIAPDSLTANHFKLLTTSAAIDKGTALVSPYNIDYFKTSRPQGSAWDIGAHEFTSGTTTVSGDLNGDGKVDIFDYTIFIQDFGKTGSNLVSDLNKDGKVDIFDYTIFSQNFGKTQ
jgi:hypothetical protein